jgi:hypothetical protein
MFSQMKSSSKPTFFSMNFDGDTAAPWCVPSNRMDRLIANLILLELEQINKRRILKMISCLYAGYYFFKQVQLSKIDHKKIKLFFTYLL